VAALTVGLQGCGGSGSSTRTDTTKEREGLAKGLPVGVILATPVVPDKLYGESSKTVADALAALNATEKNGKLYDGKGHEIVFESTISRTVKAKKKLPANATIVNLAR
jgi:hypothetical protein